MSTTTIGQLLLSLRKRNRYTQGYIANETGYSEKQIRRIEQDKCIPTVDLIYKLSVLYNEDLFDAYKRLEAINPFRSSNELKEFLDATREQDVNRAEELVKKYRILPIFQYGEGLQSIYYIESVIAFHKFDDSKKAYDKCMTGIHVIYPDFNFNQVSYLKFQKVTYNLLISLAIHSYRTGKKQQCIQLLTNLKTNLEANYINAGIPSVLDGDHHKRLYLSTLCNLITYYIREKDFQQAEKYIEISLKFTQEDDCYTYAASIYYNKMSLHYERKEITKSIETLEHCVFLANITKSNNILSLVKKALIALSDDFQLELTCVDDEYILIPKN